MGFSILWAPGSVGSRVDKWADERWRATATGGGSDGWRRRAAGGGGGGGGRAGGRRAVLNFVAGPQFVFSFGITRMTTKNAHLHSLHEHCKSQGMDTYVSHKTQLLVLVSETIH